MELLPQFHVAHLFGHDRLSKEPLMIRFQITRLLLGGVLVSLVAIPHIGLGQAQPVAFPIKVIVISLDAFGAASLAEPELPMPTLHALMKKGAYASSMRPVNPTVTWPNHTSMVTGVDSSRHHVMANGLIVQQRTDRQPHIDPNATKAQLVAVPTIYDVAFHAGLVTAEVDWVAIGKADTISWHFSEGPDPTQPIEQDLIRQGTVSVEELNDFHAPSQAWRDRIYTEAAVDIIRRHHPDLLLVHLLALDSIEHETGFGNNSGRNTLAFLDDRVKEIVDAVRENGELEQTAFIVVSDHGQQTYHKRIDPSVLLRQAGLQTGPHATACVGGLVFQKNATPESDAELKKIFLNQEGIARVLTPQEAALEEGLPVPGQTDQAPDLVLYAAADYDIATNNNGEYLVEGLTRGAHGYSNREPGMQAVFIASGAGIRATGNIGPISNLDIAPTIANLMHLPMPPMQAQPLDILLKH